MLKLIIADDENLIRKRLVQCMPWEELGYEVVSEATDGEELLNKIKEFDADVVLTDIKMPVMDGLEVAARARDCGLKTQFVIISGYNDFEYAQKGIEAGIYSYILKPIDKEKVIDVFRKLAKKLSENIDRGILYKQIFQMEQGSDENIYITNGAVAVMLYQDESAEENGKGIYDIITDSLNDSLGNYYIINRTPKYMTIIYECGQDGDAKQTISRLYYVINERVTELYEPAAVSVYYSKRVFELKSLKREIAILGEVEKKRFYLGKQKLIDIHSVSAVSRDGQYSLPENTESELEKNITNLDFESIKDIFRRIPLQSLSEKNIRGVCFLFINMLYRQMCEKTIFDGKIKTIFQDFINSIDACEFENTIYKCVMHFIDELTDNISAIIDSANDNYLINKAMLFVEKNLHKDISLKDVAENLDVSYGYISRMLNQSEHGGFVTQLKNKRIKRAKELLANTNKKIYEIAYESGFKSARYFSEVFKRETGFAPLEYRNNCFINNGAKNG